MSFSIDGIIYFLQLLHNELKRMWKEDAFANFKLGIFLEQP
jgi:hypothetical protein